MADPPQHQGNFTPNLPNPVRVKYPRRITVRLGDLDAVFEPVTTVLGKKQRLQALGHYYELIADATRDKETEAYVNCLAYWRTKRERKLRRPLDGEAHKAALEADLQSEIRSFIVSGGVLPAKDAKDPEVKVRLPGTLTFNKVSDLGVGDDPALRSVRFKNEQALWDGNQALGRIPIIFKVEKRVNGAWEPAPGEWMHVQLIAPFYDATYERELADVRALRSTGKRPAHRLQKRDVTTNRGIRQFLEAAIKTEFDASDPQRFNAHKSLGGKRGLSLLPNLFDALPAVGFPDMNAPVAVEGTHAIRVQSNVAGEGGVVFLPSRMGGDRYRM